MNCEKNTELFYKELNSNCNPYILLQIAKKGIFLYEPLFFNDKLKYHENIIEISVLAGQYFMILNRKQYQKFKELSSIKIYNIYPFMNNPYNIYKLLIINKYLMEQLMIEEDENFLLTILDNIHNKLLLLYSYKYNFISTKTFYTFYYPRNNESEFNLKFELYEHFYFEDFKDLLNNTLVINSNNQKFRIIEKILYYYSRDVNIFKFCIEKIKQYKFYTISEYHRMPLYFPLEFLKKYDDIFFPKKMYITCEDKHLEEFINITFPDCLIMELGKHNYNKINNKFFGKYYLKYDINIEKFDNFKVNEKNNNLDYIYNSQNYKNFMEERKKRDKLIFNTSSNIIKLINNKNEKYKYLKIKNRFIKKNINNLYFVKRYLNDYNEIEKILNNPEYILTQKIEICANEFHIMLLCYIISMIHKNYNSFIIKLLLYCFFSSLCFDIINGKLFFYEESCKEPYMRKVIKLLSSTPNEMFNSYIIIEDFKPE